MSTIHSSPGTPSHSTEEQPNEQVEKKITNLYEVHMHQFLEDLRNVGISPEQIGIGATTLTLVDDNGSARQLQMDAIPSERWKEERERLDQYATDTHVRLQRIWANSVRADPQTKEPT